MNNYYFPNVDKILTLDGVSSWSEFEGLDELQSARLRAHIFRKRNRVPLEGLSGEARSSAQAVNQKVSSIARRMIVAAKRAEGSIQFNNIETEVLIAKFKASVIMDGFLHNRHQLWQPMARRLRSRKTTNITVEDFSFLHNPVATANVLAKIARAEAECLSVDVDYEDPYCMDLGPWLVLAAMRPDMAPVFDGGKISNPMSKIVQALKLNEALRIDVEPVWSKEKDIWALPLRMRRPAGKTDSPTVQLDPQTKEKVGTELCELISQWLGEVSEQRLTRGGRKLVMTIVGECCDNAERYSDPTLPDDGDWIISGFMAKRGDSLNPTFRCHLALLSIGSSISETMLNAKGPIKVGMEEYVSRHRHSLAGCDVPDAHLRTIYALQDTVTSDDTAYEENRGGTGFGEIIFFFGDLAGIEDDQSEAKMAVISGRTCLHIGFPDCRSGVPHSGQKRTIWLNDNDSEYDPPRSLNLFELENDFRGTLVTMGFTLDKDYLENSING